MKKSLIALAVAGTLVASAAMADTSNVTVYGQANVSLDMVKSGGVANATPGTGSVGSNHVASNSSRLGFKGSEDLGNGLSAIFQVESEINIDGTGTTDSNGDTSSGTLLATRETFAGVKGDSWGAVKLGRLDTPYKISTRGLDLFADGIADNRSIMGGGNDARTTDTIAYVSPSMSGFSAAYARAMGAEGATATNQTKGKASSIAVMYDVAPFYATIANQKVTYGTALGQFSSATGEVDKAFKVGGGYKTDMFAVNAVIENTKNTASITETKARNIYIAGQYNISSNDAVKLAYTVAGDEKANGVKTIDSGAKQMSIGYDHNLSKRTTVYALYTKLSNKAQADYNIGDVASTSMPSSTSDADPSAFSFGLKHSF